jgi:hypothetical protein
MQVLDQLNSSQVDCDECHGHEIELPGWLANLCFCYWLISILEYMISVESGFFFNLFATLHQTDHLRLVCRRHRFKKMSAVSQATERGY